MVFSFVDLSLFILDFIKAITIIIAFNYDSLRPLIVNDRYKENKYFKTIAITVSN